MRYGLVSDIHSNLIALDAVLEDMGQVDCLLCMGDIVGYGPQPNEVVERLQSMKNFHSISGNHDLAVLGTIDLKDFNNDAIEANLWTRNQLSEENKSWLESMPPLDRFNDRITLAHGSPVEPVWEYLTTPNSASRSFPQFDTPLCFVGHTHLPRAFRLLEGRKISSRLSKIEMRIPDDTDNIVIGNNRFIINPGSVGQPRDSDPRASYAIYDDVEGVVSFRRVSYDINLTQELMGQFNLPTRLILRLSYGL